MLYFNTNKPIFTILFYQEESGKSFVQRFFKSIPPDHQKEAETRIQWLAARGNTLRRPHADYLRNGIFELRWKFQKNQYRILYFFHGRQRIVLVNAFIKKTRIVPNKEIATAIKRKKYFCANPQKHIKSF
jgi:phage-related protein